GFSLPLSFERAEPVPDRLELLPRIAAEHLGELGLALRVRVLRHLRVGVDARRIEQPADEVLLAQPFARHGEVDALALEHRLRGLRSDAVAIQAAEPFA